MAANDTPDTFFVVGPSNQQALPSAIYVTPNGGTQTTLDIALNTTGPKGPTGPTGPTGATGGVNTAVSATTLSASGTVTFTGLPSTDPHVVGHLWSNSGVVTVSAG